MSNSPASANEAWYQHFYIWLIIFLPACAVVASFATLYIAVKNPPDLVVENYSDIEAINAKNIAQDNLAISLALRADLNFGTPDAAGTAVEVRLQANDVQALPSSIVMRAVHSTQTAQDAATELAGTAGRYKGSIKLPSGNYDIFIEDTKGTWRLTTRVAGHPAAIRLHAPVFTAVSADRK